MYKEFTIENIKTFEKEHWKLDNLIPKMLEANKVCKEISNSNS